MNKFSNNLNSRFFYHIIKHIIVVVCVLFLNTVNSQVFWTDNFETTAPSSGSRTAINHADTSNGSSTSICGTGDYFFRTNLLGDTSLGMSFFNGIEGSFYWRGEDLDGCLTNPDRLEFTGIDIAGKSNIAFRVLMGALPGTSRWETNDYINISYQIDGGGYNNILSFRSDRTDEFGNDRGNLAQDLNFDGIGTGNLLTEQLTEFAGAIPATGSTMDLRIEIHAEGSGEEFAFDFFRLEENSTLSIGEFESEKKSITIYPNPVNNILNVESTVLVEKIMLYDVYGKLIYESNINSQKFEFFTNNLANGTYFMKAVTKDNKLLVKKIIIEN